MTRDWRTALSDYRLADLPLATGLPKRGQALVSSGTRMSSTSGTVAATSARPALLDPGNLGGQHKAPTRRH